MSNHDLSEIIHYIITSWFWLVQVLALALEGQAELLDISCKIWTDRSQMLVN